MDELQRTARRQFQQQTRTRALGITGTGEDRLAIMNSLGKFAGAASEETQRQMRAEIETKKALGASRAAQDLLVSEQNRQGITQDDVLATKVAYNAVVGRHDTINAGNEFVEWYQANPEATEKEIEQKKTEIYKPLFAKYSGDEESSKQFSLQVQESQFNLMPVQEQIRKEYQSNKNQEGLRIAIDDNLASPDADMDYILDVEVPAIAKKLGISEFDTKKILLGEMKTRAGEGDNRLLEALEKRDWSKGLDTTKLSRDAYDKEKAVQDTTYLAKLKNDTEFKFLSGDMSERAFLKYVDDLNKEYGEYNPYSEGRVQQLLGQRHSAMNKSNADAEVMTKWKNADKSRPLGTRGDFHEEEKKVIVDAQKAEWVMKAEALQKEGKLSQDEIEDVILKDKVKWSLENQMVLSDLQGQLNSVLMFNPNTAELGESVTGRFENNSKLIQSMPPAMLSMYLSDDDTKYALALKANMQTLRPLDAYKLAYNARYNPTPITPKMRKAIDSQAAGALSESDFTSNVFARMFGAVTISGEQRNSINTQLANRTATLVRSGVDISKAAEYAMEEYTNTHSQLPNGSMTNKNYGDIEANMLRGQTEVKSLSGQQVATYMDSWLKNFATTTSKYLGEDIDVKDLIIKFNDDGSSFDVMDKYGFPVNTGYLTTQIFELARPEDLKKTQESLTNGYENRKTKEPKREAWERRGLFY